MLPKRTFSLKYSNGEDIVDIKTIKMLYKIIEENTNKHTENKMDKVNDNDNKEKNDSFDKITNWCKDTSIYCTIWLFDFDKMNVIIMQIVYPQQKKIFSKRMKSLNICQQEKKHLSYLEMIKKNVN